MKTFLQWAEQNKLELPYFGDVEEAQAADTDAAKGEKAKAEDRIRTGYSANYPPQYVSGQYPNKYFNAHKATADLDAQNMGKKK